MYNNIKFEHPKIQKLLIVCSTGNSSEDISNQKSISQSTLKTVTSKVANDIQSSSYKLFVKDLCSSSNL